MKKTTLILLVALMVGAGIADTYAGEQIDLTAPVIISSYKVVELNLDLRGQEIRIVLYNSVANKDITVTYNGPTALALIIQMNKMNFSTNSMQKVILNKLITDGKIIGTISGIPD
jgi:hypothetical protein